MPLRIQQARLTQRLNEMAQIGAQPDGSIRRLAVSDEDKTARDLLLSWLKKFNLHIHIDQVGNIIAIRDGKTQQNPILMGSHIDTVPTGGRFDGSYGVLAGLEILETLEKHNIQTQRPIALIAFTNEEGVRYRTDLLGSNAFCGFTKPEEVYDVKGIDGTRFGDELKRIGYRGNFPCASIQPHAYLELHIEQGPVLDRESFSVGIVEAITGISWQEINIYGEANHAGTTPISMRKDAGLAAAQVIIRLREIATSLGENQRATCGMLTLIPNATNVIPEQAILTVDMRNPDAATLKQAEDLLKNYLKNLEEKDDLKIEIHSLARVEPESCDSEIITIASEVAQALGYSHRKIVSGAVHDALAMARYCPTGMIFAPSKNGISHNPKEFTAEADLEAGANVLLHTALKLANTL